MQATSNIDCKLRQPDSSILSDKAQSQASLRSSLRRMFLFGKPENLSGRPCVVSIFKKRWQDRRSLLNIYVLG